MHCGFSLRGLVARGSYVRLYRYSAYDPRLDVPCINHHDRICRRQCPVVHFSCSLTASILEVQIYRECMLWATVQQVDSALTQACCGPSSAMVAGIVFKVHGLSDDVKETRPLPFRSGGASFASGLGALVVGASSAFSEPLRAFLQVVRLAGPRSFYHCSTQGFPGSCRLLETHTLGLA